MICSYSSPPPRDTAKSTAPQLPCSTPFSQPISRSLLQAPASPVPFPAGAWEAQSPRGPLLPQQHISTKLLLSPRGLKEWPGLERLSTEAQALPRGLTCPCFLNSTGQNVRRFLFNHKETNRERGCSEQSEEVYQHLVPGRERRDGPGPRKQPGGGQELGLPWHPSRHSGEDPGQPPTSGRPKLRLEPPHLPHPQKWALSPHNSGLPPPDLNQAIRSCTEHSP